MGKYGMESRWERDRARRNAKEREGKRWDMKGNEGKYDRKSTMLESDLCQKHGRTTFPELEISFLKGNPRDREHMPKVGRHSYEGSSFY